MKQLISGIQEVSKRLREIAQTHRPLFGGEIYLTGREVCERLFVSPRTLQDYRDKGIIPYTQIAGKYSIDYPTSTDYCKRIIGDKVFARSIFLPFGNHTERTCRMVIQKIPSNLAIARYLFADYSLSFHNKSSTFALLVQEISPVSEILRLRERIQRRKPY